MLYDTQRLLDMSVTVDVRDVGEACSPSANKAWLATVSYQRHTFHVMSHAEELDRASSETRAVHMEILPAEELSLYYADREKLNKKSN